MNVFALVSITHTSTIVEARNVIIEVKVLLQDLFQYCRTLSRGPVPPFIPNLGPIHPFIVKIEKSSSRFLAVSSTSYHTLFKGVPYSPLHNIPCLRVFLILGWTVAWHKSRCPRDTIKSQLVSIVNCNSL